MRKGPLLISAILLAVAAMHTNPRTECYFSTRALADIRTIQMALTIYKVRNHHDSITEDGLRGIVSDQIISERALIDPWGTPYGYRDPTERIKAGIYSCGEDKISLSFGNDADDLNSWNSTDTYYKARRPIPNVGDTRPIVVLASLVSAVIAFCIPHRSRDKKQNRAAHAER